MPCCCAGASMEYVISHSFSQFQHEKQLPQMESRLKALEVSQEERRHASIKLPIPCCHGASAMLPSCSRRAAVGAALAVAEQQQHLPWVECFKVWL